MTAPELDEQAVLAEIQAALGGPPGMLRTGRDPVNLPMVHHWCQALGDTNPAYLDAEHAARSSRGALIAPPGMLQTWVMDAPREAGGPQDEVMGRLDELGYTSVVAVNYEHEYLRELHHGERISVRTVAEDLSPQKKTALGVGYFTTMRHEYTTDDGEVVGIGRMRLLKFKPPAKAEPQAESPAESPVPEQPSDLGVRPRPTIGRDNQYFWDGVALGELRVQRCEGCGVLRHPPQPLCDRCGSSEQGFVVSSGRGVVHSHVTHHHPPLAGVRMPHTVLLVELEEGVRFVSELAAGEDRSVVRIGLPVEVVLQQVPGGHTVPAFRPVPTHQQESAQ